MAAADEFTRWSQVVRGRGAVEVVGHHAIEVPPLGESYPHPDSRTGIRLYVRPLESEPASPVLDVTSTAVMAMLDGFLATGHHVGKRLEWRSRGFGSRRRDTLILSRVAS